MKKINLNKIKKLLFVYLVIIIPFVILIIASGDKTIQGFLKENLLVIFLILLCSFFINYLILRNLPSSRNLNNIADIIISEVFNESKLNIDYDIELKKMLKKLENEKVHSVISLEQYKNAEKIRAEFTANITHELKTPLTSIMGYAELIEIGVAKDEEARKFAKIIGNDSKELLSLIEDVITLSKYDEMTDIKINFEKFNIGNFLNEIIENFEILAKLKGITIIKNIENFEVYGDKGKIKDLVNNLISNGIKYNKENGKIEISLYKNGNNCILEVADTGIGITSTGVNRIFERFYVEDSSRGKGAGTGLGLAIVKHVAIVHKGSIDVESEKGKGSKFTFKFPINPNLVK